MLWHTWRCRLMKQDVTQLTGLDIYMCTNPSVTVRIISANSQKYTARTKMSNGILWGNILETTQREIGHDIRLSNFAAVAYYSALVDLFIQVIRRRFVLFVRSDFFRRRALRTHSPLTHTHVHTGFVSYNGGDQYWLEGVRDLFSWLERSITNFALS